MSFELEIKRLYVPGVVLSGTCPKCEKVNNVDLGDQHLSYPKVGEPHDYGFYCSGCGHEWTQKILVTLQSRAAS